MPVLNIYSIDGSKTGTVDVNNEIFGIEPNKTVKSIKRAKATIAMRKPIF